MAAPRQSIEIEFFASLREVVGCRTLSIPASEAIGLACVADVRTWVVKHLGEDSCTELFAKRTRAAVNDEFADPSSPVRRGDRVAFMPGVTGG